jgi:riboflavin biosynthesis pyrimidine reductase
MKATLFMISSVDGKITTKPGSNPDYDWPKINPHYMEIYYGEMLSMDVEGVVMSAHSFVKFMNLNIEAPKEWNKQVGVSIIVVDSRGLLNEVGMNNLKMRYKRVIVFISEETHSNYKELLQNINIEFYQTCGEKVNYKEMFKKLEELGYKKISIESGGTLNSYILRAGVVDEIHIITVPILIGGLGTPSIMDGKQIVDWKEIIPLKLLGIDKLKYGFIKSRYIVLKPS